MNVEKLSYLRARAEHHWPNSPKLQRQWVRQTIHLIRTGNHVLLSPKPDWRKPKVLV